MFKDSVTQVSEDGPPLKRRRGPALAPRKECRSTSKPTLESSANILFTPECIFCNSAERKRKKVKKLRTSERLSNFEYGGWQTLEDAFAFSKVCEVIDKDILKDKKMIKFSDLISLYVSHLQETEFANRKYKNDSVKST